MKKKLLILISYILVAALSTVMTLGMVHLEGGLMPTKLEQLEELILERFIGEAEAEKLEDAAAAAMVSAIILIAANAGGGAFIDHFGYRYIFVWDFFFTIIANVLLIVVYCRWKRYGGDKNYVPPQKKPEKT